MAEFEKSLRRADRPAADFFRHKLLNTLPALAARAATKWETVHGILPGLLELSKSTPRRLRVIRVPENEFRILTVTHIAIFNATMVGGETPDVFVELPIEEAGGGRLRGHWIRMSKGAASGMAGRFRNLIEKHPEAT